MKRVALIVLALVAVVAILLTGSAAGGDDGQYEVRAIFDNAGFLVTGEDVRMAGAKVGTVTDIDVTTEDEAALEDGGPAPGKAVVVMRIDEPGFQDFREDASCLIRPQSLIGEKFVECEVTQPRAPGSEPPPALEVVPDGQPGEGEHLLPLERNGKAVDLDLVNNIMRAPYPDRFRLILNDLGAGFAGRGQEIAEIVQRSNPALRETNEVLAILGRQNHTLSRLSVESDSIISALARERAHVAGFINQSNTVAEASAERRADLEESFARFPGFLRELRSTMRELDAFSQAATPVFAKLGEAAPDLTRATKALGPFSSAGVDALTSLGKAAEASGGPIAESDPVIKQVRELGKSGAPATTNLRKFLSSLRKTEGFNHLGQFLFNASGSVNSFDQYGHFLRGLLPLNNCVDYELIAEPGCSAKFTVSSSSSGKSKDKRDRGERRDGRDAKGLARIVGEALSAGGEPRAEGPPEASDEPTPADEPGGVTTVPEPADPEAPPPSETPPAPTEPDAAPQTEPESAPDTTSAPRMRAAQTLLDFLIGEPQREKRGTR
jgi:phospholipid/cholesterol/gamma-HCH transport system substrate-binding protein